MDTDHIAMHLEIRQVLARYCHGVDHGDLELAIAAYWPDAIDHHGGHWDGNGPDYMRDLISRLGEREPRQAQVGCMHHLTTTLISRHGPDDARVQTYFSAYVPHESDGSERIALVMGRYLDHFQRRAGEWRILERTVVNDFTRADVGGEIYPPASWQAGGYVRRGYGKSDPGVAFLGGS